MKNFVKILLIVLNTSLCFGQIDTFQWGEGLTIYTGNFDTRKFTFKEIETIYNYLHTPNSEMYTVGNVWKIEQMDTAQTTSIDHYYQQTLKTLETMKIPKGKFWSDLVNSRKKELFEVCLHSRLQVLAIKNPSILYEYFHEECAPEINALNGDSTALLLAWYNLKEKNKLKNCCPENVEMKYKSEYNSIHRLEFARLELITYGLNNCLNQFVYHHSDDIRIEKEFQRLFIHVIREDLED